MRREGGVNGAQGRQRGIVRLWMLIHGACLAALLIFLASAVAQDRRFAGLVANVEQVSAPQTDEARVRALTAFGHELVAQRRALIPFPPQRAWWEEFVPNPDADLLAGSGGCGSFTSVVGRLLVSAGYPIRILQMHCGPDPACHILLEVQLDGRWVVVDPSYNLLFQNTDGSIASYDQLHHNFSAYAAQTPRDYNPAYRFEDARRTNWDKIPVLMPLLRGLLNATMGETWTNELSLRAWVLNRYWLWFFAAGGFYAGALLLMLLVRQRRQRVPRSRGQLQLRASLPSRA